MILFNLVVIILFVEIEFVLLFEFLDERGLFCVFFKLVLDDDKLLFIGFLIFFIVNFFLVLVDVEMFGIGVKRVVWFIFFLFCVVFFVYVWSVVECWFNVFKLLLKFFVDIILFFLGREICCCWVIGFNIIGCLVFLLEDYLLLGYFLGELGFWLDIIDSFLFVCVVLGIEFCFLIRIEVMFVVFFIVLFIKKGNFFGWGFFIDCNM